MNKLLSLLGLGLLVSLGGVHAAGTAPEPVASVAVPSSPTAAAPASKQKAQRSKMKVCNKDAKDKALKGAERKAFMKECLSNKG